MWSTIRHYALAVRSGLGKLHGDQTGAEGLEKLLIIGAIVLPLLLIIIVFKDQLIDWVTEKWDEILDE